MINNYARVNVFGKIQSKLIFLKGEPVSKCSILFKVKKGENFNRRNTLSISRIKI